MGNKCSSNAAQNRTNFSYFALVFRRTDKIKLVFADKPVISIVQNAIARCWEAGLQQQIKEKDGSYEFKFHGTPFCLSAPSSATIQTKRMCCEILMKLYEIGWQLIVSSDLSQITDLTTWFFHKSPHADTASQLVVCVSISSCDSIQLINAPEYLRKVFKKAVIDSYDRGVRSESYNGKDYELRLKGYPWNTSELEENLMARKVILELFRRFDRFKFRFYATANLRGTADRIFFIHDDKLCAGKTEFSTISLTEHDRISLQDCPKKVVNEVRRGIIRVWQKGLQTESNFHLAWEFKLGGMPWWAEGEDAVCSRSLVNFIFQSLQNQGFGVVACLDISHRMVDKSVFVLQTIDPADTPHFCLSLNENDKIRLINAPTALHEVVKRVIVESWPYGLKKVSEYCGSTEFKLASNPWSSCGSNQRLLAIKMMCHLLMEMMERGWKVICSADVSAKYCVTSCESSPQYPLDVHSWFFAQIDRQNSDQKR